ncbi:Fic family protein [Nocardia rhamnosiphila]
MCGSAIAHAQFETIHPFIDGDGRTGRALIHTVLRRCAALRHISIPISTVFAARTDVYPAGLTAYRDPEPPAVRIRPFPKISPNIRGATGGFRM